MRRLSLMGLGFVLLFATCVIGQEPQEEHKLFYPEKTIRVPVIPTTDQVEVDPTVKPLFQRYQAVGDYRFDTVTGEVKLLSELVDAPTHVHQHPIDASFNITYRGYTLQTVRVSLNRQQHTGSDFDYVIDISEAIHELFSRVMRNEREAVPVSQPEPAPQVDPTVTRAEL